MATKPKKTRNIAKNVEVKSLSEEQKVALMHTMRTLKPFGEMMRDLGQAKTCRLVYNLDIEIKLLLINTLEVD